MKKLRVATLWLDGCSGCHMSLLDLDAAIISLAQKIDVVYGPLVDAQEFPDGVDVTLVEGAISSQDDLNKIQKVRQRTALLVSIGDCAVTGNVPAMRNGIAPNRLLQSIYGEIPTDGVPPLLKQARAIREFVKVDLTLPGCPPPARTIGAVITALIEGRKPELGPVTFG